MNPSLLTYSPSARWYRNYSHDLHKKKLQEIKAKNSSRIDLKEPQTRKLLQKLKRDIQISQKAKQQEIHQENLHFLKRLSQAAALNLSKQYWINNTMSRSGPLSLNYAMRKKEADRIVEENAAIVKRLNKVPSSLSAQSFLKDYRDQTKFKQLSSRKNFLLETLKPKARKLSPVKTREDNDNVAETPQQEAPPTEAL